MLIDSRLSKSEIMEGLRSIQSNLTGVVIASGAGVNRASNRDLSYNWTGFPEITQQIADEMDVGIVALGSAFEYGVSGAQDEVLCPQSSPLQPKESYGVSKARGFEKIAASSYFDNPKATYARLFQVWGRGEHETRLFPSLLHAKHSRSQFQVLESSCVRDFVHIDTVSENILKLLDVAPVHRVVNISSGLGMTLREFVESKGLDEWVEFMDLFEHPYRRLVGKPWL